MAKLEVVPFNDLSFEERNKIHYYTNKERITTIKQVLEILNDSIGQYQKRRLRDWMANLEKWERDHWVLQGAALSEGEADG